MPLRLPLGASDFAQLRRAGSYYVDKSGLAVELIRSSASVVLLPRPRRFGKTLNLSMLRYWFQRPLESGAADIPGLFAGLESRRPWTPWIRRRPPIPRTAVRPSRLVTSEAPKAARAAVWLYSEAVPRGWASPEDAALTLRVMALQDADAVPVGLLDAVLAEGRRAVSRAGPVTDGATAQAQ